MLVSADLGMASAAVLAGTFAWAGAAKLGQPVQTAAAFAGLGLPQSGALARGVPVVELGLAVALLAVPAVGAAAALVLIAGFSVLLARVVRRGLEVPCACFGQSSAPPVSWIELARNALLGGLAGVALSAGLEPRVPALVPTAAVLIVFVASTCLFGVLRRRRAEQRVARDG